MPTRGARVWSRVTRRGASRGHSLGWSGLLWAAAAAAQPAVPYAPDALPRLSPPRSVVLDKTQAAAIEAAHAPRYTERIEVIGRDPDARRAPVKPLEQRFADALNAPQGNGRIGGVLGPLDARPCTSLASMRTDIGTAYNPYGFCP